MGERTLEVAGPSSCWKESGQAADDRRASRLFRSAQSGKAEPDKPETKTRESYETESVSNDPVGDRAASRQDRATYIEYLVGLAIEQIEQAVGARRHPEDLDYRLARAVQNAEREDVEYADRRTGWASDLAWAVNQKYPGLLVSGYIKVWEEEEELAAKSKAKSQKAAQASKEKRAAKKAA